jgi:hypothetical protein
VIESIARCIDRTFMPRESSMRLHLCLLVLLAGAPLLPSTLPVAHASVVVALDLEALVQQADDVVVARVLQKQSKYDAQQRIVTDYTMQVERTEKGSAVPGAAVTVRQLGGVVGERGMRIAGEPTYVVGERVVLFGKRGGRTYLRPVGMAQGAMRVFEQDGETYAQPATRGLSLIARDKSAAPAPSGPRRLDELLGDVRELVAAQRQ